MPPRPRSKSQQDARRQLILDQTRSLAREAGWHAVTIRAVAQRCGLSAPSLYELFPSKAALLAAVARDGFAELAVSLSNSGSDDALGPLHGSAARYWRFAHGDPTLYDLMFHQPLELQFATGKTPAAPHAAFRALAAVVTDAATSSRSSSPILTRRPRRGGRRCTGSSRSRSRVGCGAAVATPSGCCTSPQTHLSPACAPAALTNPPRPQDNPDEHPPRARRALRPDVDRPRPRRVRRAAGRSSTSITTVTHSRARTARSPSSPRFWTPLRTFVSRSTTSSRPARPSSVATPTAAATRARSWASRPAARKSRCTRSISGASATAACTSTGTSSTASSSFSRSARYQHSTDPKADDFDRLAIGEQR